MTALRIAAGATLAGAWSAAAVLLWRTSVPDVDVPALAPRSLFDAASIERNGRYRDVLSGLWAAGMLAQLAALALLARSRPVPRLNVFAAGALLGGGVYAAAWLAQLPFRLAGHWWRRRYDVSELDYLRYVAGQWSTTLGELALAFLAGAAVVAVGRLLGARAWVGIWLALAGIAAVYVLVYPLLLTPRLQPLRDRGLATQIESLARQAGLGETTVEVRKARERTRAINAEAVGAGPTTRVILWDTLLDPPVGRGEVRFVAAHELAHIARRHPWKGVAWFGLLALPGAWLLGRTVRPGDPASLPAAALVLVCLQLLTLPVVSAISRRYETEADYQALRLTGSPGSAEALYRRFVRTNLADPEPPRLVHLLLSTHPTVVERIATARAAALPAGRGSP